MTEATSTAVAVEAFLAATAARVSETWNDDAYLGEPLADAVRY